MMISFFFQSIIIIIIDAFCSLARFFSYFPRLLPSFLLTVFPPHFSYCVVNDVQMRTEETNSPQTNTPTRNITTQPNNRNLLTFIVSTGRTCEKWWKMGKKFPAFASNWYKLARNYSARYYSLVFVTYELKSLFLMRHLQNPFSHH